jgi:alpha-ketoglutarate-dependent taurine dioxygenase
VAATIIVSMARTVEALPLVECTDATLVGAVDRCMQLLTTEGAVCLRGASDWRPALELMMDAVKQRGRLGASNVARIANVSENGEPVGASVVPHLQANNVWHHDGTFLKEEFRYTMLAAEVADPKAYTELLRVQARPRPLASALKNVRVVHVHHARQSQDEASEVEHPLFRRDPDSRTLNWCLGAHATGFRKLPDRASRAVLRVLEGVVVASGRHYRHVWQRNDVIVWNNFRFMHRGTKNMPGDAPRVLHRVTFHERARAATPA